MKRARKAVRPTTHVPTITKGHKPASASAHKPAVAMPHKAATGVPHKIVTVAPHKVVTPPLRPVAAAAHKAAGSTIQIGDEDLRRGLATAFRSQQTPPFPEIIARAFARLRLAQRVRVLKCMLRSVGPLAFPVVGAGVFVQCIARAGWDGLSVTTEDALRVSGAQVMDLARYVEQANPRVIEQVSAILARDPNVLALIGASVAAVALASRSALARRSLQYRRAGGGGTTT